MNAKGKTIVERSTGDELGAFIKGARHLAMNSSAIENLGAWIILATISLASPNSEMNSRDNQDPVHLK